MIGRRRGASCICVLGAFLLLTLGLATQAGATPSMMTVENKLVATDGQAGDLLGDSVAISGDYAVVGAPLEDNDGGAWAGAAYVFIRTGNTWVQYQKLTSADGSAGRNLGRSVAISGSTIVIGAPGDGDETDPSYEGAAYVFTLSGTQWLQQSKLTEGVGAAGEDAFGASVAISGERVIVGVPRDDNAKGTDAGSAHIFVRSGATWAPEQTLLPDGGLAGDWFGSSVAISGDSVAVGAPYSDAHWGDDGAAYFFSRDASAWSQQGPPLAASDAQGSAYFGASVAISDEGWAVVGAPFDDAAATNDGAAYLFARSGSAWAEQQKLTTPDGGTDDDQFGRGVAIGDGVIVVGAPNVDRGPGLEYAGSAYVYTSVAGTWYWARTLVAGDPAWNDKFGASVAVANGTAVVGAIYEDAKGTDSGSAYVFGDPVTLAPVYRFYRPASGTHFYTPNEAEKDHVIATWPTIYHYEGVAYSVNPLNNNQWLYRFYNKKNGSHFYTASESEKASVIANLSAIYSYDGPTYKVSTAAAPGKPPVWRFYNRKNGSHFYTADPAEKANVIANLSGVYTYEGIAFWLGQ